MCCRRLLLCIALLSASCLEQCAPGRVGAGVARLSVRNVGAILQLVNADEVCGFESAAVKEQFTADGQVGQLGSVTWSIEGCEIDLTAAPMVTYDCDQVATSLSGRIVVSAKRTVAGTLTGNAELPVVPLAPDAVTIELTDVELFNFAVETSASDNKLTLKSGHLSAVAKPRLAAASDGICQIATPNVEIQLKYSGAEAHVVAEGRSFDVTIPSSDITAVNGVFGERENWISGSIEVWGKSASFDEGGEHLDPDYDPEKFVSAFACTEDLSMPLSYECGDVGTVLAQGAARLTIRNLGAITFLIEEDTACGFTSEAVLSAVQLSGPVGEVGEARFRVEGCTLSFPPGSVVKESCTGEATMVSGSVTVTATKIMNGRLTGDLTQPVVPVTDSPARFEFDRIAFTDFLVEEAGTSLKQISGAMSAKVQSRTAMDTELTACGFKTPIARMTDVAYVEPARVLIRAPQGTFDATIDGSQLAAVNGTWADESNALSGSLTLNAETHAIPTSPSDTGLDPEFDQAAFDRSWMCGTVDRENPFECRFGAPLAQGTAQLTAITLGTIADLVEADTTCGFSSPAILSAVSIQGELGNPGGTATFAITTPCELTFAERTVLREDCNGKQTIGSGTVRVTGTKTLSGYVSGDPLQPIVPTSRDPAEIALALDFSEFSISTGDNRMEVHAGRLSGSVRPRTAIDTVTGACSIPTPAVLFDKMTWTDGDLTVVSAGRTFNTAVSTSDLEAVNGNRDGVENSIAGTIVLEGETYAIPIRADLGLDPDYDPALFLASFACTPNLQLPASEADCNMNVPLGEGVARLLIFSLGTVAGLANSDKFDCGFGATGTLMDPIRVEGDVGQMGEMEWRVENCELTFAEDDGAFGTDCLETESHMYGLATITGNRVVEGLRDEISIIFISVDSIIPNHRRAVLVTFESIHLENFVAYELAPDQTLPDRRIRIASADMTALVEPVTGENNGEGGGIPPPTEGAFDVPTKVARMRDVHLGAADVTILYLGKTFNVHVDRADLYAFNGSWDQEGETNTIRGEISVNGQLVSIEPEKLDPDYDQTDFDSRYVCTPNLVSTIPPVPGATGP